MRGKRIKIAVLLTLLTVTVFVVDVLSPVTPTPRVDIAVKLLFAFCSLLISLRLVSFQSADAAFSRRQVDRLPVHPQSRMLIFWICALLC